MSITFSTCWYIIKAKFSPDTYTLWIDNMLSNVNNYNLVVYCNEYSYTQLAKYLSNPRIMIIIKPFDQFYNYRYANQWNDNHNKNFLLNDRTDWKLNMLWSEKVHFVNETMTNKYFDTDFYGWCDIGYFRGRPNDLEVNRISAWPSPNKISDLKTNKIYYACINNNNEYINQLSRMINNKNEVGLPVNEIPANQLSIAGGFFIAHKSKLQWWVDTYAEKLELYFRNGYLVKDDQIIVADCIFSNLSHFQICSENNPNYDNWFLFQRYLL